MTSRFPANLTLFAALIVVIGAVAAASAGSPIAGQMHRGQMHQGMMGFGEAEVSVSDLPDGVALTFTTKTGDIAGLRNHVRYMAEMFNTRSPMQGRSGEPSAMIGRGMMISARASVEDVPEGARLTLVPTDSSQLETLRSRVRFMAERMQASGSMMMSGMMMSGPMQTANTDVSAADVPDGVALNFTTTPENVAELQQRVEQMAGMFGSRTMMHGEAGRRGAVRPGMMMLSVTASFEKLADGARVVLKPTDPSDLDVLRSRVGHMADMMSSRAGGPGR
jgi:hypothetical protein